MSLGSATLQSVLTATGYFPDGQPAAGLHLGEQAQRLRHGRDFSPDALWRSPSALNIYFKFEKTRPADELVGKWRREIWNEGFAPLLWVVSPEQIDLYNGFGTPARDGDAQKNLIQTFENVESSLYELDALAGRLAMETGQFWHQAATVDRKTSVDQKLLSDLANLERDLVESNLERGAAQALIGRAIFTQYLFDRGIVNSARLSELCGYDTLPPILRDRKATECLFEWLSEKFNGDMFPSSAVMDTPKTSHLARVGDFLEAVDSESGQQSFFPYQFDVIPVELISSIYEQFAHSGSQTVAQRSASVMKDGVHYTRLSVVSLVLDEVMDGLSGNETVLDLTCGSGVFLVEALRRLVSLRAGDSPPSREIIRSTLYEQVFGVDISEAAVRVAAFGLYLAALELDPDPQPPDSLKFKPLIGRTLVIGNAHTVEKDVAGKNVLTTDKGVRRFDLIVGNPPWSFRGKKGTVARRKTRTEDVPVQPRGEGLDFVMRAEKFSHDSTRFGIVLSAMSFFSRSGTGMAAAQHVIRLLSPVTLVNLSNLRDWLFPTAKMPAVVLFARHRTQRSDQMTIVQVPWTTSGPRTHTFEISPNDISKLSLSEVEKHPLKLKAAAVGRRRDLALLDSLTQSHASLAEQLSRLNTKFRDGLTRGSLNNQTRDARTLRGLEILQAKDMRHLSFPQELSLFKQAKAQWPRSRDTYRAPLLIVKEMLVGGPRVLVAVSERDIIFSDVYFGVSLPSAQRRSAHLLAAILSSSMASWFLTMTASEFGIWKRRLLIRDVGFLPVPDFSLAVKTDAGKRLLRIENKLRHRVIREEDWVALDDAVCDLYELDAADRVVIRDGLFRSSWQWDEGRISSVAPADIQSDVSEYAQVFLSVVSGWLSARKKRRMRAEVFDLPPQSALRIVRFVLENGPGKSTVKVVRPDGELAQVLYRIGGRLQVKIATALAGNRELRIHGRSEVVIIKPAARRYWMGVAALEDADAVVAESFTGAKA